MILLDCINKHGFDNHIIAVARPDVWEKHINVMFEGGLYQITNVYVRDAVGRYRPVTNSNVIHFLPVTVVTLYPNDSIMIPFHKFELTPLGDLRRIYYESNPEHVPEQSTDVIGVLENLEPVRTIQTIDGPTEFVKFTVNDGSIFIGRVQLGNIDSSRIYVNLDIEDVSVFRNRFQHSVSRDWCLGSVMCFKQANAVTISSYEHLQFKKLMLYIIFYKIPCCLAI
ncbi:hypothetical protein DCAR_0414487 [Daucus carota subsp. sativus]|uniref:DUF223 domain-containing protein n=1 Tax=Daucus carota subsp. sativus TaxID=79200 RepID=A0AAF0WS97_DAUCS|nr:hypothetical protein DCAR_0414487 [Daucus carota subsp. sativus]